MSEGRLELLSCKNREQEAAAKIIFKNRIQQKSGRHEKDKWIKGLEVIDDMKLDDTNRSKDQVGWGVVQPHWECYDFRAYVFIGNMGEALSLNRKD